MCDLDFISNEKSLRERCTLTENVKLKKTAWAASICMCARRRKSGLLLESLFIIVSTRSSGMDILVRFDTFAASSSEACKYARFMVLMLLQYRALTGRHHDGVAAIEDANCAVAIAHSIINFSCKKR